MKPGQARCGKDKQLYQSQLSREAKLIVQGWQEWLHDLAVVLNRFLTRLGTSAPKAAPADAGTY